MAGNNRIQFGYIPLWFPNYVKGLAKKALGDKVYSKVKTLLLRKNKEIGLDWELFCSLRRVEPIRRDFGWRSGQPIDRYYTEVLFLPRYANDIHGRVLEMNDPRYTRQFGRERVTKSDVLDLKPDNPEATIVADLTCADQISSETFDCIILTFTLQYIYDVRAAIRTLHRILKPGGVLLAAFPGISQISRYDMDNWGEHWRFTTLSARRLFSECFPSDCLTVQAYGNVLSALASLHGIVAEELHQEELDYLDRDYEFLVTIRAVKPQMSNRSTA